MTDVPTVRDDFLARRVRDSLQRDDNALDLTGDHILVVELSSRLCSPDSLTRLPDELLRDVAFFCKRLDRVAANVANATYFVDTRNPNGPCRFKRNENLIVAFIGDTPIWFWEKEQGRWELYQVGAFADFEEHQPLWDESLLDDCLLLRARGTHAPSRLAPKALLGVLWYFRDILRLAAGRMAGRHWLPDIRNRDSGYAFKTDGAFTVAYRCADVEPLWCWKKHEDERWRQLRMRSCESKTLRGSLEDGRLCDGDWDGR